MRSFKHSVSSGSASKPVSTAVTDENTTRTSSRMKTKSHGRRGSASGSDKREVLGELKTENHSKKLLSKSSLSTNLSSVTSGVANATSSGSNSANGNTNANSATVTSGTSAGSKIQIFKQQQQQYHYQFKKPRLERILKHMPEDEELTDEEFKDQLDEEDEIVDEYDNIDEDKENNNINDQIIQTKEYMAPQVPSTKIHHSHENSDDVLREHFEKILHDGEYTAVESLDPSTRARFENWARKEHEMMTKTQVTEDELVVENDLSVEESSDEQLDEAGSPKEGAIERGSHYPMEPIWTKKVAQELHYVVQKYSRSSLDENDEDTFDVTMVAEYAPEIFNYMRELENRLVPDPNYMDNQDELKWEMRSVLIDWVVQVHSRFNLLPETLYLTVNYIDRFLSKRKVSLSRFQLVGAVALFIAAKYEEINCPTVQEVAYMADNAYSIDDFLKAERFMIDVLEFDMGWPGPMSFLRRTSKADDYDYETRTLAKYFLETTVMDSKFVASPPSWLAAGAHYLSRKLLNRGGWTELHVFYSGYIEAQLRPLAEVLLENCRHAESNHKAIFEKYQERRYRRSSAFVQEYFDTVEQ